jgi:hypothetical protein
MPAIEIVMKKPTALSVSVLILGLLLAFSLSVMAQSGRRANKPGATAPLPVATPVEPDVTAKPSPSPAKPLLTLLVGMEDASSFSRIPLGAQTGVLQNCVKRLEESPSVKVTVVGQNISRGEAIKMARAGKEAHVVWLQVRLDRYSSDQGATVDASDVSIEYVVYAPVTAKVVTQGHTYPQAQRSIIPTTRNGGLYGDSRYNKAAREAAERILAALKLSTRPIGNP